MHIPLGDVPFAGNKVDFPFLEDGPKPTRRQESSAHAIHIWTFSGSEISIPMTQRDQRTSNWCNWKKGPVLSAFQLFPGWCSVCIPVFPIVPAENPIFIPYSLHVKLPRWNLHESCRRISTEDILSSTTASQSMEWWDVDEHRCSVAPRCTVGGT